MREGESMNMRHMLLICLVGGSLQASQKKSSKRKAITPLAELDENNTIHRDDSDSTSSPVLPVRKKQSSAPQYVVNTALNQQALIAINNRDDEELHRLFTGYYQNQIPNTDYLQTVFSSKTPLTLLMYAIQIGNARAAMLLIEATKNIHIQDPLGWTALMHAVAGMSVHNDIIQALTARNSLINYQDTQGFTPLMRAIQRGNVAAVSLLVAKGADIPLANHKNSGRTALDYAQGNDEILKAIQDGLAQRKILFNQALSDDIIPDIMNMIDEFSTPILPSASEDAPSIHQLYGTMPSIIQPNNSAHEDIPMRIIADIPVPN